jgi:hypothetical protein
MALTGAGGLAPVSDPEWNASRGRDLMRLRGGANAAIPVDPRNIYDPKIAAQHGVAYRGPGRRTGEAPASAT